MLAVEQSWQINAYGYLVSAWLLLEYEYEYFINASLLFGLEYVR